MIFGDGSSGSGTTWISAQLDSSKLHEVATSCMALEKQLVSVALPSVTWKPFTYTDASASGKYELTVDATAPTQQLLTDETWGDVLHGIEHVCKGIDAFALHRNTTLKAARRPKPQY